MTAAVQRQVAAGYPQRRSTLNLPRIFRTLADPVIRNKDGKSV
jgi:hypothetical protein